MGISVVIPTRDRPASLARSLRALARQDAKGLEIVVVDDGSRDREAVSRATRSAAGVRLIRLAGVGPASARNAGARAAEEDVVLFTDDDCEPEPEWVATLARRAEAGGVAAGLTVPPPDAAPAAIASQAITNHLQLAGLTATGRLDFAPTCNLGCSRDAIRALPFDESYPDAAGEDRDWCARAVAAGLAPAYEPEAVVVHNQALGIPGLLRQQLRYGRGAVRFRRGATGDRGFGAASFYAGLLRAGFASGPGVGGLVVVAQVAVALGAGFELVHGRTGIR